MAAREPRRSQQQETGFSLGDLSRIFRRRWLWFFIPMGLGMVLATAVALGLPAIYEASTTILIEPPKIPQGIVETTVVQDKEARFHNIRLQILSRDDLSDLIDRFELDPRDGTAREDLVTAMRDNISIEPILPEVANPRGVYEINSMRIAFRSGEPAKAADVANALARDFIRQNMQQRAADAEGTSEFIAAELARENKQGAALAEKIKEFKEEHLGSLPEQLETSRRTLEKLYLEMNNKKTDLDFASNQVNMLRARLTAMRTGQGSEDDDPLQHKQDLAMQLSQAQALGIRAHDVQSFSV
ncbi:MAG: GumC family protein, partial [Myxococcota bacterium]